MAALGKEVKVVLLGAERTGKKALVKKYIDSTFTEEHNSSFEAVHKKHVSVGDAHFTLNLFAAEPSGENHLCRLGDAFILVYAINNRRSFQHVRQLHNQLRQARGSSLLSTPVFLAGNKSDLEAERQVTLEEGRQLAVELGCQKLFEISARSHTEEIDDMFSKAVREKVRLEQGPPAPRPPMTPVHSTPEPMPSTPTTDDSPRRSSVLDRLKFGSIKRKGSIHSLARKKSGSFGESIMSSSSARPSRDNIRSVSYGNSNGYGRGTPGARSNAALPYKLDVDTSAWRETVKWPTEIIPEEDLHAK